MSSDCGDYLNQAIFLLADPYIAGVNSSCLCWLYFGKTATPVRARAPPQPSGLLAALRRGSLSTSPTAVYLSEGGEEGRQEVKTESLDGRTLEEPRLDRSDAPCFFLLSSE